MTTQPTPPAASEPRGGALRVFNIINPPNRGSFYPVSSPQHAYNLIERMAKAQLEMNSIHSNVFGLEVFEDGEWSDWYSEDGDDLDAWAELHPELIKEAQ